MNGILADQMGLGKTITTISLIGHLWHMGVRGPFLVVAPLSTVSNWIGEFQKWTPGIPVILYYGTKPERAKILRKAFSKAKRGSGQARPDYPVVVSSYETVLRDYRSLIHVTWKYLVVDEAHRLKNFECKLICALRKLHTESRLLLTGTPLQNSLSELWSLLNFLLPDLFSDLDSFKEWFNFTSVIENSGDAEDSKLRTGLVDKLHEILRPFLLRRLKQDVEINIPQKAEVVLYCSLTPTQRALYQALKDRTIGRHRGLSLNNLFMQLRKASNHPFLFPQDVIRDAFQANRKEEDEDDEEEDEEEGAHGSDNDDDDSDEDNTISRRVKRYKRNPTNGNNEISGELKKCVTIKHSRSAFQIFTSRKWTEYNRKKALKASNNSSDDEDDDDDDDDDDDSLSQAQLFAKKTRQIALEWASLSLAERQEYEAAAEEERRACELLTWEAEGVTVPTPQQIVDASGKMRLLHRMLPDLRAQRHKVLIFSQMTRMLDIIEDYVEGMEYPYVRIDGAMSQKDRQANIDAFNANDDVFLFLLSTRAGGQGINLTAADTVIIYDSDWNPQMDIQAQDRCHRIGQTRNVVVYRFVVANTVDSKVIKRARSKLFLERLVIGKGAFSRKSITKLTQEDIRELIDNNTEEKAITEEGIRLMLDRDYIMKNFARKKRGGADNCGGSSSGSGSGGVNKGSDVLSSSSETAATISAASASKSKSSSLSSSTAAAAAEKKVVERDSDDSETGEHGFEYVHEAKTGF